MHDSDQWLKENDPLYGRSIEYPYLSDRQMRTRSEREIPIGILVNNIRYRLPGGTIAYGCFHNNHAPKSRIPAG